jgi:hypothetical protein
MREARAGRVLLALVVLVLLVAAGGVNYVRNTRAEAKAPHPFGGYDDAELEALIAAHRSEVQAAQGRYEAARGRRTETRDTGFVGDQVKEFERVRRESERTRDLGAELSMQEAALRDLEAEQRRRAGERDRVAVILRRLFTF